MRTNARIWTHADEADRLADLVLRRLIDNGNVKVLQGSLGLVVQLQQQPRKVRGVLLPLGGCQFVH